jgi:hypothetical protein
MRSPFSIYPPHNCSGGSNVNDRNSQDDDLQGDNSANPFNTDANDEKMGGMFGAGEESPGQVTPGDLGGAMPGGPTGGYGDTMLGAIPPPDDSRTLPGDSGAAGAPGTTGAGATGDLPMGGASTTMGGGYGSVPGTDTASGLGDAYEGGTTGNYGATGGDIDISDSGTGGDYGTTGGTISTEGGFGPTGATGATGTGLTDIGSTADYSLEDDGGDTAGRA